MRMARRLAMSWGGVQEGLVYLGDHRRTTIYQRTACEGGTVTGSEVVMRPRDSRPVGSDLLGPGTRRY